MSSALLLIVVVAALAFAWTNGFHDAANAVATSLTTGALTPRVALGLAAGLNSVGALAGIGVAQTVGHRLISVPIGDPGLGVVLAALAAAIGWNLLTWWLGLPSSSSHALIGALAGAGLAAGVHLDVAELRHAVLLPMILSPVFGLLGGLLLVALITVVLRDAAHGPAVRGLRLAQTVSASAMALGHGLQDGQKTMGVVVLGLIAAGHHDGGDGIPLWVRVASAAAIGAGTAAGGRRIITTVARRITVVDPLTGFAAETVSAAILFGAAGLFGAPVSSTQAVVASITGAGLSRGPRVIRWGMLRRILLAWVLTPLVTAALAAALFAVGARVG